LGRKSDVDKSGEIRGKSFQVSPFVRLQPPKSHLAKDPDECVRVWTWNNRWQKRDYAFIENATDAEEEI